MSSKGRRVESSKKEKESERLKERERNQDCRRNRDRDKLYTFRLGDIVDSR